MQSLITQIEGLKHADVPHLHETRKAWNDAITECIALIKQHEASGAEDAIMKGIEEAASYHDKLANFYIEESKKEILRGFAEELFNKAKPHIEHAKAIRARVVLEDDARPYLKQQPPVSADGIEVFDNWWKNPENHFWPARAIWKESWKSCFAAMQANITAKE